MSYLALLKDLVESETTSQGSERPSLKLVVNRAQEEIQHKPVIQDEPIYRERNLVEVIQWRMAAKERLRRRLAGQIPDWPLSKQDAAIYERLIDQRCERLGLNLTGVVSVLSVHRVGINSEINQFSSPQSHSEPSSSSANFKTPTDEALTKPTEGGK